MGNVSANETRKRLRHAKEIAEQLDTVDVPAKIELLKRCVERITVHANQLEIAVRVERIVDASDATTTHANALVIEVPITLQRRGCGHRLVVHATGDSDRSERDPKLVALIGKAHAWFDRLTSGEATSIQAIAATENVSSSYATRVIYLAFLAPDLVQRIVLGDHASELNSERLMSLLPLPLTWDEQRAPFDRSS